MRTEDKEFKIELDDRVKQKDSDNDNTYRVIEIRGSEVRSVRTYGKDEYNQKLQYLKVNADELEIVKKNKKFYADLEEEAVADDLLSLLDDDSVSEESNSDELLNLL